MTEVTSGQIEIVSKGEASYAQYVDGGGTQEVLSGGESLSATIFGTQTVFAGGVTSAPAFYSGGLLVLLGEAEDMHLNSGSTAVIYSGGESVSSGIVAAGAVELVSSGGYSTDQVFGVQYVYSGARTDNQILGVQYVSGGTLDGGTVGGGVYMSSVASVFRGGSSIGEYVSLGGHEVVGAGGLAENTDIDVEGSLELQSGATGVQDVVSRSGQETVDRGATETNGSLISSSGVPLGTQYVYGVTQGETIDGDLQYVYSGGETLSDRVGGGWETVSAGGQALDTSLFSENGSHGGLTLQSGASASGTYVGGGGQEIVFAGAVSSDSVVALDASQFDQGLTVSATIAGSAAVTGEADYSLVVAGGVETVGSGGQDIAGTVNGLQILSAGAVAGLDSVSGAGASQVVLKGAIARYTSVGDQGTQTVSYDGSAVSATVGAGGLETVQSGGAVSGVTVFGSLSVASGAIVVGATIGGGGDELLFAGATQLDVVIADGGALTLADGQVASGQTFAVGPVAAETTVSGVTLELGASVLTVSALVASGAREIVASGGVASGTAVGSGGIETIRSHGAASGTVLSGGIELDYGRASGTVVLSGGHEIVEAHGAASRSVIDNGGREAVSSEGVALAATVSAGGTLIVSSGGAIRQGLTLLGGKAIVLGTMSAGQTVSFTGSAGLLQLDNLAGFHARISGLSVATGKLDLGGFAFSAGETASWRQAGTSGTLTITDGTRRASLTMIGTYVTSDFTLANDRHGGSFVTATPASPAATPPATTTRFAQAIAGFHPGGRDFAMIHAGGSAAPIGPSLLVTAVTSGR